MTTKTYTKLEELVAAGWVTAAEAQALAAVSEKYAMAIPPQMAASIAAEQQAQPAEQRPLARQFLPDRAELAVAPQERDDPIGDEAHSPMPGLVHRYPDRVLLKPLVQCAVYCRFCFRREQVGSPNPPLGDGEMAAIYDYIAARPTIREVILSGGDPLILSPARLQKILHQLAAIPHIEILRLHSRVPVVAPERINPAMLAALRPTARPIAVYILVHSNHASEFSPASGEALAQLAQQGVVLLGQSVLLRGVNDSAASLIDLFRTMIRHRITPHYLHHPDLAPGTAHFRLTIAEGLAIMQQLRGRISGLMIPHYILDIPGGYGKIPLNWDYVSQTDGGWEITDPNGMKHFYTERMQP
ncbi:MAG: lysine-2,3-aminomutase-like protein [Candidatus Symbiobacter sp.]|nr:lysine-2,3-aminomutase-like protein [Candidatus Symbiobacter sp.]